MYFNPDSQQHLSPPASFIHIIHREGHTGNSNHSLNMSVFETRSELEANVSISDECFFSTKQHYHVEPLNEIVPTEFSQPTS